MPLIMLPPNDGSPSRPGQPTNVRAAVVGGNRMDLQWTDNAYNESGFRIERRTDGVYKPIATVGANVTRYSDTGLSRTANPSYRVKAYNAVGDSDYSYVWIYSGWTEINLVISRQPAAVHLLPVQQPEMVQGSAFRPEHVALNNDSDHGRDVTIDVDVGAWAHEGNFYVYFFYQDKDNWYRLNTARGRAEFEKRIDGTTTQLGSPVPIQNLGNGSPLQHWRIEATRAGTLKFIRELPFASPRDKASQPAGTLLDVSETFSLPSGKIGLGGWARTPVWENFHFDTASGGAATRAAHPPRRTRP